MSTLDQTLILIIQAELAIALLGSLYFITQYLLSRWNKSAVGWMLMFWTAHGAAEIGLLYWVATGHRPWVWLVATIYGLLDVLVIWRAVLLVKTQGGWDDMASWVYSALRTGAQALWGWLVLQAGHLGITLPNWAQNWFVETVIVAGGIAAVTAVVRWLETRKGDSFGARAARWVAQVIMLGLSGKQPVYARPVTAASPATVTFDDSRTRPALRE